MKNKDLNWLNDEIEKVRSEKRKLCSSVSSTAYNKSDAKKIKEIKEDLKKKRRSIKRSEKQTWKNEVKKYEG
jgi:hypothetical protein